VHVISGDTSIVSQYGAGYMLDGWGLFIRTGRSSLWSI